MTRNVRRVAAGAILVAVACNVYDPSLLVGNSDTSGGTGGTDVQGGGTGGDSAGGATGGSGGSTGGTTGGAPLVGGSGGTVAGGGGTSGGGSSTGGVAGGTGGSDSMAGEAGEAGMTGEGGTGGGSGMGGSAGKGGSAGAGAGGMEMGGSSGAGMGGSAGTSGSGGSAGASAGMAGMAGSGGSGRTGCATLTVPLTAASDKAHYDISFPSPVDMSASTVTVSMDFYVSSGAGGVIDLFVQDSSSFHFLNPAPGNISTIASFVGAGWRTMTWNIGSEDPRGTGLTKNSIKRIGVEISGANATNPAPAKTVVYIDSMSVSLATPQSFTFDASTSITTTATSTDPSTAVMWLNNYSGDTTDPTNTKLAWQATCP
jgi:hypothetical protein